MKFKGLFSVSIAISIGLIILLGYFVDSPTLNALRIVFLQWAVILTALAVFIGVINLLIVHLHHMAQNEHRTYSLILIAGLLLSLSMGLVLGPQDTNVQILFESVVIPGEASLMALLAVSLLYASVRLLQKRRDLIAIIFIATAFVTLLASVPMPFGEIPGLNDFIRPYITQVLAAAGARGILIGVGLGILTTGVRVLLGIERPYGGRE